MTYWSVPPRYVWNVTPKFHTSHWVLFLNWSFLWIYLIMHVFWFTKKLFEHLWKFFAFTELHVQWWPKPKKWQNKSHHSPISCAVFIGTRLRNDHLTQSATQCAASVHTLHMPKPVITFVFKVLRNALLRYILYTCPNLWSRSRSKCTQCTAAVHTLHILDGSSKKAIPLPLCAASLLSATQRTYSKNRFFFFIGILPCYVFIGFCNRFSHGGEVMWGW